MRERFRTAEGVLEDHRWQVKYQATDLPLATVVSLFHELRDEPGIALGHFALLDLVDVDGADHLRHLRALTLRARAGGDAEGLRNTGFRAERTWLDTLQRELGLQLEDVVALLPRFEVRAFGDIEEARERTCEVLRLIYDDPRAVLEALHSFVARNPDGAIPYTPDLVDEQVLGAHSRERRTGRAARVAVLREAVPDFVGRQPELAELLSYVEEGSVQIFGIWGPGGTGKTELALAFGEQVRDRFSAGQHMVDGRATDDAPLGRDALCGRVLAAVDPDHAVEDPERFEVECRRRLEGKETLVVVDDASEAEQVQGLLPVTPGSLLVVTSQVRFQLPGMRTVSVEELPSEAAVQLALDIAPHLGERAAEVAEACGYLALAVRLAANAFAERPELDVDRFLRRERDAPRVLDLGQVVARSADELEGPVRRLWSMLSVFPRDFTLEAAADVWDLSDDDADEQLGVLRRRSLVAHDPKAGRYRMHRVVRQFAGNGMSDADEQEARARHAAHYLRVLAGCDDDYLSGGPAIPGALRVFDLDRDNILAAQAWAAGNDDRLASSFPDAGANVLDLRLVPRQMQAWLEAAVAAAKRLGDQRLECSLVGNLGLAVAKQGDARGSLAYYERQIELAEKTGKIDAVVTALGNTGAARKQLGEFEAALAAYSRQAAMAKQFGDVRSYGLAMNNAGVAIMDAGDPKTAIRLYSEAEAAARRVGDLRLESAVADNWGIALREVGDLVGAKGRHERHLALARELGDRQSEANALGNLGIVLGDLGEHEDALRLHEENAHIARGLGDQVGLGNALTNQACALDSLERTEEAIAMAEGAIELARQTGHRKGEVNGLLNLSRFVGRTDPQAAVDLLQQASGVAREIGYPKGFANSIGAMGGLHARVGDIPAAVQCWELRASMGEELADPIGTAMAHFNIAWVLRDSDLDRALPHAVQAADLFTEAGSPHAAKARGLVEALRRPPSAQ